MKTFLRILVVFGGGALLVLAACRQAPPQQVRKIALYPTRLEKEPAIRVQVLKRSQPLELRVTGAYILRVRPLRGPVKPGGGDKAIAIGIAPTASGVKVGQDEYRWLEIEPRDSTRLILRYTPVGGGEPVEQAYIWPLRFTRSDDGAVRAVVTLGLEEYLVGVVPNEMPASWSPEALKAQAVASRTYALYQIRTRTAKDFDVHRSVKSQVWKPSLRHDPRAVMAVNATRGVVMTENYRIFPAHFHSRCGGRTARARFVWLNTDLTALTGVGCEYCSGTRAGRQTWRLELSKKALSDRLAAARLSGGMVKRIRALDANRQPLKTMGRAYFVAVETTDGAVQHVAGDTFRKAVGHDKGALQSTWFEVDNLADKVVFVGRGYGHGVGMCQYGAKYLAAEKGMRYPAILRHYYVGAVLVRLWDKEGADERP